MTRPKYINKPFQHIPIKHRACLILHLGGLSVRQISSITRTPKSTISDYISRAYGELETDFRTNLVNMRGKDA